MKVNRCLESFLVPESVSSFLDRLDLGVQPFTHRIGDRMRDVRKDIGQMALDQMSDFLHRLQSAVGRPPEPAFLKRLGLLQGRRMPESPKFLLHGPGPAHFQIQCQWEV